MFFTTDYQLFFILQNKILFAANNTITKPSKTDIVFFGHKILH